MGARSKPERERHYHGHVDQVGLAEAEAERSNFVTALNGADEVAEWLAEQLRSASGKPELALPDELRQWQHLAGAGEQISTGLQVGPTIIAVPIPEDRCPCERPELRPVTGQ